jgi:hypothetical protein
MHTQREEDGAITKEEGWSLMCMGGVGVSREERVRAESGR